MRLMMEDEVADDYVVATGEAHQIREFLELAFEHVGLDYRNFTEISGRFKRPMDVTFLKGESSKLKKKLNWKPKTDFKSLVKIMVDADIERWKSIKAGKIVPTDGIFYDENVFNIYNAERD